MQITPRSSTTSPIKLINKFVFASQSDRENLRSPDEETVQKYSADLLILDDNSEFCSYLRNLPVLVSYNIEYKKRRSPDYF